MSKAVDDKGGDNLIRIHDTDTKTFEYFQHFFYWLHPKLPIKVPNEMVNILYFAEKYMIDQIKQYCIKSIQNYYISNFNYSDSHAKLTLQLIMLLFEKGLIIMIETTFLPRLKLILQQECDLLINCEQFYQFPLKLFELFMFDKTLGIVKACCNITQDQLWDCCLKWAKAKITHNTSIFEQKHNEFSLYNLLLIFTIFQV